MINHPWGTDDDLGRKRREFVRDGFQSADHRLAGMFVWRFHTQPLPPSGPGSPPQVVALFPVPGSVVPVRTFLEIQFDQPMAAPTDACPHLVSESEWEEFRVVSRIQYDAARHLFRIPLLLAPSHDVALTLTGFRSAGGIPAPPIPLRYQVSGEELATADRDQMAAAASEPRLLQTLETLRQKRLQLTSLSERIQNLTLLQKDGLFYELQSESAVFFKWQKPGRFYCDITGPMLTCSDSRLGSDGQQWWWHDESIFDTNFVVCPVGDVQNLRIHPDLVAADVRFTSIPQFPGRSNGKTPANQGLPCESSSLVCPLVPLGNTPLKGR